jgi:hypothetical protein
MSTELRNQKVGHLVSQVLILFLPIPGFEPSPLSDLGFLFRSAGFTLGFRIWD